MLIHQKILNDAKEAMLKKDKLRLDVLRGLKAAFMNEMIAKNIKDEYLPDDIAISLLKRACNQRNDSIQEFQKGHRDDLVNKERSELKILEEYMPQMMSVDKIREIAVRKKEMLKIEDKSKAGVLIGAIIKESQGLADGAKVKEVVNSLFSDK
jgi:hypothetical protein